MTTQSHLYQPDDLTKLPGDHPGGSLNTTPPILAPRVIPTPGVIIDLEDDAPLDGGSCNLDGPCESCQ